MSKIKESRAKTRFDLWVTGVFALFSVEKPVDSVNNSW